MRPGTRSLHRITPTKWRRSARTTVGRPVPGGRNNDDDDASAVLQPTPVRPADPGDAGLGGFRRHLVEALRQARSRTSGALDTHGELHDALQRRQAHPSLSRSISSGRRPPRRPSRRCAGPRLAWWIDIIPLKVEIRGAPRRPGLPSRRPTSARRRLADGAARPSDLRSESLPSSTTIDTTTSSPHSG